MLGSYFWSLMVGGGSNPNGPKCGDNYGGWETWSTSKGMSP
jgi:hypothetical protein